MEIKRLTENTFSVEVTKSELFMILAGLREADQELEDWEFQTRTGFERTEMREMCDTIARFANQL